MGYHQTHPKQTPPDGDWDSGDDSYDDGPILIPEVDINDGDDDVVPEVDINDDVVPEVVVPEAGGSSSSIVEEEPGMAKAHTQGHNEATLERLMASSRRHGESISRRKRYPSAMGVGTDQEFLVIESLLASNHPDPHAKRRKF